MEKSSVLVQADPFDAVQDDPDPETMALLEQLRAAQAGLPRMVDQTPQELRERAAQMPRPPLRDDAVERGVPGPAGEVPLRILGSATSPRVVYVRIHGGGWIGGAHDDSDDRLFGLAERLGGLVVSVGYRLAPEHKLPAPADDCEAGVSWIVEHAAREFGTESLLIGGESAGAHLAAVTMLRLRDRHGYSGFRAADLRYGMYDLRLTPSVRSHPFPELDREQLTWLIPHVVDSSRLDDPDVSPLFADLRGLPPAIFTCGTGDSLLDDSLFMWARWRAAGNDAQLALYPGAPHGFDLAPTALARTANERIAAFLESRL
jgi:acetyl esterase/lipase